MTYLQLVNKVMLRLREREVSTVQGVGNANSYARLIGEFINEAKDQVTASWEWSSLKQTLSVNTVNNVFSYELNGTGNMFKVLDVYNDTSNFEMQQKSSTWFNKEFLLAEPQRGAPIYYNFNGTSADSDVLVDIYPIPDGEYALRFNVAVSELPLTADADVLLVPSRPVILLATAMAIEERGEDGGQQSINAYASYRTALADEIAFDAARNPEATTWYSV